VIHNKNLEIHWWQEEAKWVVDVKIVAANISQTRRGGGGVWRGIGCSRTLIISQTREGWGEEKEGRGISCGWKKKQNNKFYIG